jgi:hypothetical protein
MVAPVGPATFWIVALDHEKLVGRVGAAAGAELCSRQAMGPGEDDARDLAAISSNEIKPNWV